VQDCRSITRITRKRKKELYHWSIILGGEINHIALPVTIGTLTFMQYAADQQGLKDLSNTINAMIANIPRIHNEILSDGEKDEEE
jgi:hypothetical protein